MIIIDKQWGAKLKSLQLGISKRKKENMNFQIFNHFHQESQYDEIKIIGKEGEKGAFSYKHTQSDAVVNCDMSYLYSSNNSIDVTVSCAGKEDGKGYVIDFVTNLQAPLIFKNGKLCEGEIDITYKDSSNSVIHAFTTEVVGAASSPYRIDDIVIYK